MGIDWADAKHDICLLLPSEEDGRHVQIENTTGKLREALRAGGAKNDRWDCRLQAELVKLHVGFWVRVGSRRRTPK